jgi:hypothetical protein
VWPLPPHIRPLDRRIAQTTDAHLLATAFAGQPAANAASWRPVGTEEQSVALRIAHKFASSANVTEG